jgi:hypothetical protein
MLCCVAVARKLGRSMLWATVSSKVATLAGPSFEALAQSILSEGVSSAYSWHPCQRFGLAAIVALGLQ